MREHVKATWVLILALALLGVVPAVAMRSSRGAAPPTTYSKRPNLVFILTDDQRSDSLWAMPRVRSLLAHHGVVFDHAFVTTSLCCPSRASILTGQYSRHTGVYSNLPPDGGAQAFPDRSTLATWLHSVGYTTALVGKYLNKYDLLPQGYEPPGWDEWDAFASPDPKSFYGGYTLNQDGTLVHYGALPDDYSTNVLTRLGVRFVQRAQAPFFLYFAPNAPHLPSIPLPRDRGRLAGQLPPEPPSFVEPDIRDKPWSQRGPRVTSTGIAAVQAVREDMAETLIDVDRSVQALYQAVQRRGGLARTVFVLTSDNGYLLGEHRLLEKGWPYEEAMRVPLIVRAPGIAPPGRIDHHLVLNVDLAATLCQLAGVRPGLPQDGRSLLPLIRGSPVTGWRASFLEEFLGRSWPGGPPDFEAIHTERYVYVEYRNGWRELYDLRADPYALTNLAGRPSFAALERGLAVDLHALSRSLGGLPPIPGASQGESASGE